MDLKEKEFTYGNLVILQIRSMMDDMVYSQELTDAEIVNISLDIMRILMEYSSGLAHARNERDLNLLSKAMENEDELIFFIHSLYIDSSTKNSLLNEVFEENEIENINKLIKHYKEDE